MWQPADRTDGYVSTIHLPHLNGLKQAVQRMGGVVAEEGLWLVHDMVLEEGDVGGQIFVREAGADLTDALVPLFFGV